MADRITSYLDLITSQHRLKPKYIETVTKLIEKLEDGIVCVETFDFNFSIDTATGNQLDIVGEIIGCSRKLGFTPSDSSSSVLDDDDYRFLIKSKIAQNTWDGTTECLENLWSDMFPDSTLIIYDNQDMTCSMLLMSSLSAIQIDMLQNNLLLPKPDGVTYSYSFVTKTLFAYNKNDSQFSGYNIGYWQGQFKLFAFDMDSTVFKGWDQGEWA